MLQSEYALKSIYRQLNLFTISVWSHSRHKIRISKIEWPYKRTEWSETMESQLFLNSQRKSFFIFSSIECWRLCYRWIWLRVGSSTWCWFSFDWASFDDFSNCISKSFFVICIWRLVFHSVFIDLLKKWIRLAFWWSCFMKSDMSIEWTGSVFVSWHLFSGLILWQREWFMFVLLMWRFGFLKIFWI